jgi:hypothetical protein
MGRIVKTARISCTFATCSTRLDHCQTSKAERRIKIVGRISGYVSRLSSKNNYSILDFSDHPLLRRYAITPRLQGCRGGFPGGFLRKDRV